MLRLKTFGGLAILQDGAPAEGPGAQRRRVALLALLAAAGERGLPRDKVLTLLWPESDPERARKNLAQAVYALRRDLGAEDLITGTTDLRLNPDHVTSDLAEFRAAIASGLLEEAVALYEGPFLDGVYLEEAPEFERWVDMERGNLAHAYVAALEKLARQATARGDHRAAVGFWRRLANADQLNGEVAAGLMRALAAQGDRGTALQYYRVYETLLRQELEIDPDPALQALAEDLRAGSEPARGAVRPPASTSRPVAPAPPAAEVSPVRPEPGTPAPLPDAPQSTLRATPAVARPAPAGAPPSPPAGRSSAAGHTDEYARPRPLPERSHPPAHRATDQVVRKPFLKRTSTRLGIGLGFALGALVAAITLLIPRGATSAARAPVVAVGRIQDFTRAPDGLTRPLADMLATDLARVRGLQVISTARMYELMVQGGLLPDTARAIMKAARAAGASELIDGSLHEIGPGRYRLDLRRTSLATGNLLTSYSTESGDLFELVASARKELAGEVEAAEGQVLADVTTGSVLAHRLYEEGLRALVGGEQATAYRLFGEALAEDSTFAMAAYWLARSGGAANDPVVIKHFERAVRLARHASDRERLTILAGWASAVDDPSRIAIAETLTVRYPNEPEGYLWLAHSRSWDGDFLGAIPPLRRVIAMDSLALASKRRTRAAPVQCYACSAYDELMSVYHLLDSLPAARRTAEEWIRKDPGNAHPHSMRASLLMFENRHDEALAAMQAVLALAPGVPQDGFRAQVALRTGDLAITQRFYEQLLGGPLSGEGNKWLSIVHRTRGRPRDALGPARAVRATETPVRRDAAPYNALFEAQVWFDLGEFRRAAALFDSISRSPRDSTPSQLARNRVWTQSLRATALAAAGDTAQLAALADSVERWGRQSAYGRDRRLHHHIRGLLFHARGNLEAAAAALEQAIFSPTVGYTRTNLELGRVMLKLDRPREAAAWAEAGLRGPFDGSNTYVTSTELAELAATAWDAAGVRDSAVTRYRQVVKQWRDADPAFSARVERARLRLATLSGQ